jgi:hypothetical protein
MFVFILSLWLMWLFWFFGQGRFGHAAVARFDLLPDQGGIPGQTWPLFLGNFFGEEKSGRGLPQSKTLREVRGRWKTRPVVECASPLAL